MNKTLLKIATIMIWGTTAFNTHAAKIYTCENNGDVIYTSRPLGNCASTDLPKIGRYSSSRYDDPSLYVMQTPSEQKQQIKKHNVSNATKEEKKTITQSKPVKTSTPIIIQPKTTGNASRRLILEQELANEKKALSDIQKSLAQARGAQSGSINSQQISNMQSSVLDRQQNIQALQRELSRM